MLEIGKNLADTIQVAMVMLAMGALFWFVFRGKAK